MFNPFKIVSFWAILALNASLSAQPVIDLYLKLQIPASRGVSFSNIEETYEILNPQGSTTNYRVVQRYNPAGKIISEVKYNSAGGVQHEISWDYNGNGNPVRKFMRQFINYKGWVTEEDMFKYNDTTGYLSDIQVFYGGKLGLSAQVISDSTGKTSEVNIYNEKGVFIGIERLVYVPASNSVRVLSYRSNEQFVGSTNYPIDPAKPYSKPSGVLESYPNGDTMVEVADASKPDQGYFYEYKYDSGGNWTEKLAYRCKITSNNRAKGKELEYKVTRKIAY